MATLGDAKGLQRWMIVTNTTAHDVLPDFTTLIHALGSGNMRCLKWMGSLKEQIEAIFMDQNGGALSKVIEYGYLPIIKQFINIPRVLESCKNDWKQRIVGDMFKRCENIKVVDYVLGVLDVSEAEDMMKLLSDNKNLWSAMEYWNNNSLSILKYIVNKIGETEFAKVAFLDNERNVLEYAIRKAKVHDIQYLLSMKAFSARYVTQTIGYQSLSRVKQIMDIIGETCFIDHVFKRDGANKNGLDHCFGTYTKDAVDKLKYLMSFAKIKEKCMNDINTLWTMVYAVQAKPRDKVMMAGCMMTALGLTETKLREIQSHQYPEPENEDHLNRDAYHSQDVRKYWNKTILDET
eukprot:464718_1